MNGMPQRVFDLLRRNGIRFRRAVEQHPNALAAGSELPHALQEPLRVAHRGHVGIRDQVHRVGGVQRSDRARVDLAPGVNDDVFVLTGQQAQPGFTP